MVALVWRTPFRTQATVTVQMDMREQTVNLLHVSQSYGQLATCTRHIYVWSSQPYIDIPFLLTQTHCSTLLCCAVSHHFAL